MSDPCIAIRTRIARLEEQIADLDAQIDGEPPPIHKPSGQIVLLRNQLHRAQEALAACERPSPPGPPLGLDLLPSHDLQIDPELVINGHRFTAGGTFTYTVHNWPKILDIHNQGSVDAHGAFSRIESRGFASIGIDVELPEIEVSVVDAATGRSITAAVSAEPFVVRFGA